MNSTDNNKFNQNHLNSHICEQLNLPFFILRNFLDCIFSVILSYGFFVLSQQLYSVGHQIASEQWKDNFLKAITALYNSEGFFSEFSTLIIIITILVMAIDDFTRSKILTYLSPCRSIDRFGLDVIIPFFWGFSFFLAKEKSVFFFSAVGMAFLFGAKWAHIVELESKMWYSIQKKCSKTFKEHPCPARIQGKDNWNFFGKRLVYILRSHLCIGFFYLAVNSILILIDCRGKYWSYYGIFLLLTYFFIETFRFRAESEFIKDIKLDQIEENYPGILKTIIWIPNFIRFAMDKRKK